MITKYRVRIKGVDGAASETAAVRLIASLPRQWSITLLYCTGIVAALEISLLDNPLPEEVAKVVDDVLTSPAMRGWTRDGPVK